MTASLPLVSHLAYLGVGATDVDAWERFATQVMGLHVDRLGSGSLRMRLDAKLCRMSIQARASDGVDFIGWAIADGLTLEDARVRLDAAAVQCESGTAEECAARGVDAFLWFLDPLGHRVEICHRHLDAIAPLRLARPLAGFKTGALGLGHVVLMNPEVDAARRFYVDVIGMRLSDYTERPFNAQFFHVNARHHSLALIQNQRVGLHHLMLELLELDDVGQTYDLLDAQGVRLGASLGRHTNDFMTSFYMFTPSGFMIEYGWGGRLIDVDDWSAQKMDCGPSLWGHERTWLDAATRSEAAQMRRDSASRGLKAKVVVTPGHYIEAPSGEDK